MDGRQTRHSAAESELCKYSNGTFSALFHREMKKKKKKTTPLIEESISHRLGFKSDIQQVKEIKISCISQFGL